MGDGNHYSVATLCGLFGKSKQAYYQYDDERLGIELAREAFALEKAREIRRQDPGMGCANLWRVYRNEFEGENPLGRDRFVRLLEENGFGLRRRCGGKPRTTDSRHGLPTYPDLVWNFIPEAPDQLWVTDITYIPIYDEDGTHSFCYLTVIMDAYDRRIIEWELADSLHATHSIRCLCRALASEKVRPGETIHHSDRGVQYASYEYTDILKKHSLRISMTQTGNPKDNAQAERINSTLKNELLKDMIFISMDEARKAIAAAVDFYNNRRPHMSLGYLTPAQAHLRTGPLKKKWTSYREIAINNGDHEAYESDALNGAARRAPRRAGFPTARSEECDVNAKSQPTQAFV